MEQDRDTKQPPGVNGGKELVKTVNLLRLAGLRGTDVYEALVLQQLDADADGPYWRIVTTGINEGFIV